MASVMQPTAQRCAYCRDVKPGRYRAPSELATRSGHGWTQGRQSVTWICGDCDRAQGTAPSLRPTRADVLFGMESLLREMVAPEPELCPDCKSNGVTWQHVEGGYLEKVKCGECEGRGYYEETTK